MEGQMSSTRVGQGRRQLSPWCQREGSERQHAAQNFGNNQPPDPPTTRNLQGWETTLNNAEKQGQKNLFNQRIICILSEMNFTTDTEIVEIILIYVQN